MTYMIDNYLVKIANSINSKITKKTIKALKKQNVPRNKIADGIPKEVYKRFGWEPSVKGFSEKEELNKRREFIINQGASTAAIDLMDNLSNEYEKEVKIYD